MTANKKTDPQEPATIDSIVEKLPDDLKVSLSKDFDDVRSQIAKSNEDRESLSNQVADLTEKNNKSAIINQDLYARLGKQSENTTSQQEPTANPPKSEENLDDLIVKAFGNK